MRLRARLTSDWQGRSRARRPRGGAYDGWPGDLNDAARRGEERVTLEPVEAGGVTLAEGRVGRELTGCALDLRWLA